MNNITFLKDRIKENNLLLETEKKDQMLYGGAGTFEDYWELENEVCNDLLKNYGI